jgi:predicted dehydrogenase
MHNKKVNWGILSTAKIGREKVIPAMQKGQFCHISAVASRSLEQTRQFADVAGIAKA